MGGVCIREGRAREVLLDSCVKGSSATQHSLGRAGRPRRSRILNCLEKQGVWRIGLVVVLS